MTELFVAPSVARIGESVTVDVTCLSWTAEQFDGRVVGRQFAASGTPTVEIVREVPVDAIEFVHRVGPDGLSVSEMVHYSIEFPIVADFAPGPLEITGGCEGYGGHSATIDVGP